MLIGINGFKRSGKSTVGQILADHHNFQQVAFAKPVKEVAALLLGISVEQVDYYKEINAEIVFLGKSFSMRVFLQRIGGGFRPLFGEDFWVDILFESLPQLYTHHNLAITDARYENELLAIRSVGGYNVRIVRPGVESDGHDSEQAPPLDLIDYIIDNNLGLVDLQNEVHNMVVEFVARSVK